PEISSLISAVSSVLDRAIAAAGKVYSADLLSRRYGVYDLRACSAESYRLSQGEDLCYDRPSSGLVYGLWYHPRRINTCLRQVIPALLEDRPRSVVAYDLGAGTGAFLWAFALTRWALKEAGLSAPDIHVVNID